MSVSRRSWSDSFEGNVAGKGSFSRLFFRWKTTIVHVPAPSVWTDTPVPPRSPLSDRASVSSQPTASDSFVETVPARPGATSPKTMGHIRWTRSISESRSTRLKASSIRPDPSKPETIGANRPATSIGSQPALITVTDSSASRASSNLPSPASARHWMSGRSPLWDRSSARFQMASHALRVFGGPRRVGQVHLNGRSEGQGLPVHRWLVEFEVLETQIEMRGGRSPPPSSAEPLPRKSPDVTGNRSAQRRNSHGIVIGCHGRILDQIGEPGQKLRGSAVKLGQLVPASLPFAFVFRHGQNAASHIGNIQRTHSPDFQDDRSVPPNV